MQPGYWCKQNQDNTLMSQSQEVWLGENMILMVFLLGSFIETQVKKNTDNKKNK